MNKAIILCIALVGGFTGTVYAASDSEIPIEHYSYSMKLDIAKVISISEAQDVCGAVPEHMIYEDSKGIRHDLEYQVMGSGCSGG